MLEQHVIKFGFESREKRSAEYYRGFAANSGNRSLPNILFWRNSDNKSICETPEVRWVPSYKGFSIVASEEFGEDLNSSVSQLMGAFLGTELNAFEVARRSQRVDAVEVDDIISYRASRVIYDASKRAVSAFREKSVKEQKEILTEYLKAELIREAECWGVDESVFIDNANHIIVQKVLSLAPVKVKDKSSSETKRVLARYDIKFSMPIQLKGVWQVGRQRSKGYGVIRPEHKGG